MLGVMEVVGALVVVTILSLLSRLLQRGAGLHLNLPPSPLFSLPLLGHLFHLRNARSHAFLQRLRHKLGPIFTLFAGSTPIIYITSASLAHEALVQKGRLFAARPFLRYRTPRAVGIAFSPYGLEWRTKRRNLVHQMLAMPKILSVAPARTLLLDRVISRILADAGNNEGIVSIYPNIRSAMFQLVAFMCFGFHMPEHALLQLIAMIDEAVPLSDANLRDHFYPIMRVFAWKRRRAERAMLAKQVKILTTHFKTHQELQKLGQIAPGSYLETLFHMNASTPLSTDDLIQLCLEFLVASTDGTLAAIEWTMARLVVDESSIQNRLYDQIHDVVGDRLVEEQDLPNLPYLHTVIKETLRLHPPGHFLLPHAVSGLCKLGGYDIAPNAIVLFHITSISRDAYIWEEPLQYRPERFDAADVDMTWSKDVKMMPFGAGPRICPGLALAVLHMELIVARLVQAFQWLKIPAEKTVDFTEDHTFTVKMKYALKALVKERRAKSTSN